MTWLIGSVGQAGPGELRTLLVTLAVPTPVALALDRPLRTLEFGDEAATALGARVEHALPVALPTGVVTGAVGAPYLVWLLITVNREGRGG